jgi:hypothetical protein
MRVRHILPHRLTSFFRIWASKKRVWASKSGFGREKAGFGVGGELWFIGVLIVFALRLFVFGVIEW